eukprot:scpid103200/ scgid22994/ 
MPAVLRAYVLCSACDLNSSHCLEAYRTEWQVGDMRKKASQSCNCKDKDFSESEHTRFSELFIIPQNHAPAAAANVHLPAAAAAGGANGGWGDGGQTGSDA